LFFLDLLFYKGFYVGFTLATRGADAALCWMNY